MTGPSTPFCPAVIARQLAALDDPDDRYWHWADIEIAFLAAYRQAHPRAVRGSARRAWLDLAKQIAEAAERT